MLILSPTLSQTEREHAAESKTFRSRANKPEDRQPLSFEGEGRAAAGERSGTQWPQ